MKKASVMGTLTDRLDVAKHSFGSDALGVSIVKATNNDICAPKKKHVDHMLDATYGGGILGGPGELVKQLFERLSTKNWVTVFKTLIVFHTLMREGTERFNNHLTNAQVNFNVFNFLDKTSPQAICMSGFIRRYAVYLEKRISTFALLESDLVKSQATWGSHIKKLQTPKLFEEVQEVQKLLEKLLDMEAREDELDNYVIISAYVLIMKDLLKLYAVMNEYVICVLESFFEVGKPLAKTGLEIYKKYVHQTGIVMKFLEVARTCRILDDDEVPNLRDAPTSLLKALEDHVRSFDVKGSNTSQQTKITIPQDLRLNASSSFSSSASASASSPSEKPRKPSIDLGFVSTQPASLSPSTSSFKSSASASFSTLSNSNSNSNNFAQQLPGTASTAFSSKPSTTASPSTQDFFGTATISSKVDLLTLDDFDPISDKGRAFPTENVFKPSPSSSSGISNAWSSSFSQSPPPSHPQGVHFGSTATMPINPIAGGYMYSPPMSAAGMNPFSASSPQQMAYGQPISQFTPTYPQQQQYQQQQYFHHQQQQQRPIGTDALGRNPNPFA